MFLLFYRSNTKEYNNALEQLTIISSGTPTVCIELEPALKEEIKNEGKIIPIGLFWPIKAIVIPSDPLSHL